MTGRPRIGEMLEQMGKLSPHDIDEILHEQSSLGTKKSFGEIALTWGLCEPEHIWRAWANQLSDAFERVDLQSIGVDTQAVSRMPRELAVRFCAMPLRDLEDELVIAVSDPAHIAIFEELHEQLHAQPRFVLADATQIRQMIDLYYPKVDTAVASAAAPASAAAA
jgi:type IV pilus assembly protein PilB